MSEHLQQWEVRLDDVDAAVYPIGVVAELLGVSVQVVRRFDDEGVVEPHRSEGGQRRYSRREIERLAHALQLGEEGISAAGIRRIMALEDELAAVRGGRGSHDGADSSRPDRSNQED